MELRKHQSEACSAIRVAIKAGKNPAAQLATGTGKSLIIADLASDAAHRVWVLTHSQELVRQNADTYQRYTGAEPGIVCAGLNRFDYREHVIFGTIQSMFNPAMRDELTRPSLVIVDEAHRVNHKTGEFGQYGKLFHSYQLARRVGMTATPWRTDNGIIYGDDPKQFWFDSLAYKYTVPQGVADGWLSPLVGVETEVQLDLEGISVSDDYNNTEVAERETNDWLRGCALSLLELAPKRKHIAVYCPTVVAAMRASAMIHQVTGWSTGVITGSMSRSDRQETLHKFKTGELRVLCSVDTLTTGWDMPQLDCLVCLRPTQSSNLWVQLLGRGTRIADGKKNCVVFDFVGNLQRLGGVDTLDTYYRERSPLEPVEAVPAPPREPRKVYPGVRTLAVLDPTSGEQARDGAQLLVQVHNVNAVAIPTRRNPAKPALLVQYACTTPENARIDASLFVNTEDPNNETFRFFGSRGVAVTLPEQARKLSWVLKNARRPSHVIVRKLGRYWNVESEIFEGVTE